MNRPRVSIHIYAAPTVWTVVTRGAGGLEREGQGGITLIKQGGGSNALAAYRSKSNLNLSTPRAYEIKP